MINKNNWKSDDIQPEIALIVDHTILGIGSLKGCQCTLLASVCQICQKKIHFVCVGNKINGFNVTIARNGVGCLLLLLLLPNGHALKTHGTQKGNAIVFSVDTSIFWLILKFWNPSMMITLVWKNALYAVFVCSVQFHAFVMEAYPWFWWINNFSYILNLLDLSIYF